MEANKRNLQARASLVEFASQEHDISMSLPGDAGLCFVPSRALLAQRIEQEETCPEMDSQGEDRGAVMWFKRSKDKGHPLASMHLAEPGQNSAFLRRGPVQRYGPVYSQCHSRMWRTRTSNACSVQEIYLNGELGVFKDPSNSLALCSHLRPVRIRFRQSTFVRRD